MKKKPVKGHTTKHAKGAKTKHTATKKHTPAKQAAPGFVHGWGSPATASVHTKAKHPAHAKAKALALAPGDVACCAAEALAADLRLQGLSVPGSDVLELFWRAEGHPDAGLPVAVTLEAAARFGLAGFRQQFEPVALDEVHDGRPLILGVELPGPHTVLATAEGWWSWGELYCPCEWPDAVVDEAWAVTWA